MTAFLSPSNVTPISFRNVSWSFPFGPSTRTTLPWTSTLTLAGTTTGCFPIRDIFSSPPVIPGGLQLPDPAKYFAADLLGARSAVTHQPTTGTQDCYAKAVKDRWKLFPSGVDTAAR